MQRRKDIRKEAGRLTAGQINRRRFVMSALATGVTLPTAMSLATKAEAKVPRQGGHLSIAMRPGRDFDALLGFATGSTLTEIAGDGTIVGDLACRITPEQDGKVWVFDLEPQATFADGTPVTASHVVESLERTGGARLTNLTEMLASAPDQIVMTLAHPDMTFPGLLASPRMIIRKLGDAAHPVGSGGYTIDAVDEGTIHLVRRPDHWKAGRAHVDAVSLSAAPSAASLQADVMAGKVHYAAGVPAETTAFLAHLPDLEITRFPATRALVLHAASREQLGDARTAIQALRTGIDRQAFIDRALLGHGLAGDDTPLPPSQAGRTGYDPQPTASVSPTPISVARDDGTDWLPHLADFATEIGVPLGSVLSGESRATLRASTLDTSTFADWLAGDLPTGTIFGDQAETADRFHQGLRVAKSLQDDASRRQALAVACVTVAACNGLFVPAWATDLAVRSRKLVHPGRMSPNQPNDGHRMIERWWFA